MTSIDITLMDVTLKDDEEKEYWFPYLTKEEKEKLSSSKNYIEHLKKTLNQEEQSRYSESDLYGKYRQEIKKQTIETGAQELKDAYHGKGIVKRYKSTSRPVTLMEGMCQKTIKTTELGTKLYMPVVRYPIYHTKSWTDEKKKSEHGYCGTFYFPELESFILLDLGKVAVFGSKVHAYYKLGMALAADEKSYGEFVKIFKLDTWLFINRERTKPTSEQKQAVFAKSVFDILMNNQAWYKPYSDLYHLQEYYKRSQDDDKSYEEYERVKKESLPKALDFLIKPFYFEISATDETIPYLSQLGGTPMYPSDTEKYKFKYMSDNNMNAGIHDWADQPICRAARHLGIDTLVLQREVGEQRTVSELLDTRFDSYQYLYRVTDRNTFETPFLTPSKKYPTVWFPGQHGFVMDRSRCYGVHINTQNLNIVDYKILKPITYSAMDLSS